MSSRTRWVTVLALAVVGSIWYTNQASREPVFVSSRPRFDTSLETAIPTLAEKSVVVPARHRVPDETWTEIRNPFADSEQVPTASSASRELIGEEPATPISIAYPQTEQRNAYTTIPTPLKIREVDEPAFVAPDDLFAADNMQPSSIVENRQPIPQGRPTAPRPSIVPEANTQLLAKIEYGNTLARKGATFAAQHQFAEVLELLASQRDFQMGNTEASQNLARAWKAIEEGEDFSRPERAGGFEDVASIIDRHESNIISPDAISQISKPAAIQAYYTFAREHMQLALGKNAFASRALYSIGKLNMLPGSQNVPKSMICHYAAMDCDANNFASANELGVLLARLGHLQEAELVLRHSVNLNETPASLQNLAKVQQQLGNLQSANVAYQRSSQMQAAFPEFNEQFEIVSTEQFERMPPEVSIDPAGNQIVEPASGERVANLPTEPGRPRSSETENPSSTKRSLGERLKSLFY